MKLTAVEEQIKDMLGLEDVLCCLDQHAGRSSDIGRACLKAYAELDALRTKDLDQWNAENPGEQIHRCTQAALPYHTEFDGPCEVYTANPGKLCEICDERRLEALHRANAERAEYFAAKRRGEDV